MNVRDKELYNKCYSELSEDEGYYPVFDEKKFADLIRADEREACAKVCEEMAFVNPWPIHYAHAIRARGNT